MTRETLPCVEIEPPRAATRSVVWLHGLGADGNDFAPAVPLLGLDRRLAEVTRFVFPHAPSIPVTINGGFVMPAWYDIRAIDLRREHDEAGVRGSAEQVRALIAREAERGVPAGRVVLAGFSQGGAMALHVGLRHAERLAGIVALSCYLVGGDSLARELAPGPVPVPVFMAHGTEDPMVPLTGGEHARDALAALGVPVEWKTYRMAHQVCEAELRDIGDFLGRCLASG